MLITEADIYIARSPSAFKVEYNPHTGEYDVIVDQSKSATVDHTYPAAYTAAARRKRFYTGPGKVDLENSPEPENQSSVIEELEESVKDKYAVYYKL